MYEKIATEIEIKLISDRLKYRSAKPYGYKMELKGEIRAYETALALIRKLAVNSIR